MNQKLRELAEQSEKQVRVDAKDGMGFMYFEIDEDAFRKKFAELIVRECASLVVGDPTFILAHFGVEEEVDEIKYCPMCGDEWSGTSCGISNCGWITGSKE